MNSFTSLHNTPDLRRIRASKPFRLLFLFFLLPLFSNSQCAVAPAFPGCTPAGSIPLTDGATINAGTTMTFSGSATYASVTLNGGTLIVCGTLNISSFTMNSGTVYVNTGATINHNSGSNFSMGAGSNFYNNGTSSFSGHVTLNANCTFINDFYFGSPFNYIIVQGLNSVIVNNYQMEFGGFMAWIPSSPACLCLGGNSWSYGNYFYNRTSNSVVVPSGNACLNVRQFVSNTNAVTANPGLSVCVPTGISYSGAPNWGSATVNTACPSCLIPLSIELLSFSGHLENNDAILSWSTMSETNNCRFSIERSTDAVHFSEVGTVDGAVNSNTQLDYGFTDHDLSPGPVYYYRLKQEDCGGGYSYSSVIALAYTADGKEEEFVSQNTGNGIVQLINTGSIAAIELYSASGQLLRTEEKTERLDLSDLPPGIFLLKISSNSGNIKTYKVRNM